MHSWYYVSVRLAIILCHLFSLLCRLICGLHRPCASHFWNGGLYYIIYYLNQHNAAVSILTYAGGDRIMRNFMVCSSTDIKWDEMGVACGIHGREMHIRVLVRKFEGKMPLGRSGVGEMVLWGWVWINLVHGRNQWQGLVNTVIHLLVPLNIRHFVTEKHWLCRDCAS